MTTERNGFGCSTARWLARWLMLCSFMVAAEGASAANARVQIDCPLREARYSIDSPLIDVLLKPEARALVDREVPVLLQKVPPMLTGTTPPTFSAIMTLRVVASFSHTPDAALSQLNDQLMALPVSDADQIARCARYDIERPQLVVPAGTPSVLLFEKMTGFRDDPSVAAASAAVRTMAQRNGWALASTDKGGAITPQVLKKFDVVIWNNVSGDVLTLSQRRAFKHYIEQGGGFVGFHGSAGDPVYFWDWYVDTLIGAQFIGHPMSPQFQLAQIHIEDSGIGRNLAPGWTMKDEWYSFKSSPRVNGAHVIATLDESTYSPEGRDGQTLRMGDHPIAWTRCINDGRSFYSAIGHLPENYAEPHHVMLLEQAIKWAAGSGATICKAGKEVARN